MSAPLSSLRAFVWVALAFSLSACATTRSASWGENATLTPPVKELRRAVVEAARDPVTWIPLVAALALQVDDADTRISDWARSETPCFGSRNQAVRASDYFRDSATVFYATSALATSSGDTAGKWMTNKMRGVAAGVAAYGVTFGVVSFLKDQTDRVRPDGSNDRSFPSGHASGTSAMASLAARNIEVLSLPPTAEHTMDVILLSIVTATAWARVEGSKHYPSDTLAGIGLGHFFGSVVNDAFLRSTGADVRILSGSSDCGIRIDWHF